MSCAEYQLLKLRYESTQKEYAQHAYLPSSELAAMIPVTKSGKLKFRLRLRRDAALKRMFDHRINCLICRGHLM